MMVSDVDKVSPIYDLNKVWYKGFVTVSSLLELFSDGVKNSSNFCATIKNHICKEMNELGYHFEGY